MIPGLAPLKGCLYVCVHVCECCAVVPKRSPQLSSTCGQAMMGFSISSSTLGANTSWLPSSLHTIDRQHIHRQHRQTQSASFHGRRPL